MQGDAPIRIQNERDIPHLAIAWLLLECNPKLLEPLAGFLDIIDGNRDMSESFPRFRVAVGIALEVWIRLGSMVMGELEDA